MLIADFGLLIGDFGLLIADFWRWWLVGLNR
jgi:hypothetical protein